MQRKRDEIQPRTLLDVLGPKNELSQEDQDAVDRLVCACCTDPIGYKQDMFLVNDGQGICHYRCRGMMEHLFVKFAKATLLANIAAVAAEKVVRKRGRRKAKVA